MEDRPGAHGQGDAAPAIPAVETATAAFIGEAVCGPEEPRLVVSFDGFSKTYGDTFDPDVSFLPFAVQGFFANGGARAYVVRVGQPGAYSPALAALEEIDEVGLVVAPRRRPRAGTARSRDRALRGAARPLRDLRRD